MAAFNHSVMIEEDAADLQFPKDGETRETDPESEELDVLVVQDESITSDPECCVCKSILTEPYVKCANCNDTCICPPCFSTGQEIANHKNNHDYVIVKNEFPILDGEWSAREELQLLNVLQTCGFGNWVDVAKRMPGKSPDDCRKHYLTYYVDNPIAGLPKFPHTRASLFGAEPTPYLFKLQDLEEPPRFLSKSANCRLLAGYNAARSDFEVNFDNHAELPVSELKYDDFEDDDELCSLGRSLQVAIFQAYNHRLRERARRQRIIREHGLIAVRRTMSWLQRYEPTLTRPGAERMLVFMQLLTGMEFDCVMEGLHHAGELRNQLNKLVEFRRNGLRHFYSVPMFKKLMKIKQENDRERKVYLNNADLCWKSIAPGQTPPPVTVNFCQRKPPPPLDIVGLPGHDKLSDQEKELCSSARIVPDNYLDFKQLLIAESKKMGSLRLAQARVLLKIDVNKTRKIYDFLELNGYIVKPIQ